MNPVRKSYYLLRYLGPRVVGLRASVYLNNALGITRRAFAQRPWASIRLREILTDGVPAENIAYARFKREQAPKFLFPLGQPPRVPEYIQNAAGGRQPGLFERLQLLAADRCIYFFRTPSPTPIDWCANPFEHGRSDPEGDWFAIPTYAPTQGDPRTLWEPARAAWAIDLARAPAHGFTGDTGTLLWRWVDSFMDACPPFQTFQWKCGQESAVRFIAIALGFWSLAGSSATTPKRWTQFARLAWATGYRIYHHLAYAVSQKNNHAISEACGLMLIGHLFPELCDAAKWARRGRQVLEQEIVRQVYADGTYVQQSMNYHRVMLQGALLAARVAELSGQPLSQGVYDRIAQGAEFLFQMLDPVTGFVPNYGHNDGAWILPLSERDFRDFRPVVQAASYLSSRRRLLPAGPWDEDLLWLFGREALTTEEASPRAPQSTAFDAGGYYTLRHGESWAMLRCHTHRDRVTQNDMLHLDLWWRGQNILQDCGTYRYYIPGRPDLESYFKSPAGQNTVEIDGRPALENVSRFLYLPWSRAWLRERQVEGDGAIWLSGELYDYDRRPWKVLHRRTLIALDASVWVIVDDLIGSGVHQAVLRWHLIDAPYKLEAADDQLHLHTPKGDVFLAVSVPFARLEKLEVIRGRDAPGAVQGFASPYYGELLPTPALEATYRGPLQMRFVTSVGLGVRVTPGLPGEAGDEELWTFATPTQVHQLKLSGAFRPVRQVVRAHGVSPTRAPKLVRAHSKGAQ